MTENGKVLFAKMINLDRNHQISLLWNIKVSVEKFIIFNYTVKPTFHVEWIWLM